MASHPEVVAWRKQFFAILRASLADSRLWFIVLPAVTICGLALVFLKSPIGGAVSVGVGIIAGYLIVQMQTLPRPDERRLAESIYQGVVLPAVVGILVIPSYDIFARACLMPWHWLHTDYEGLPCSYLWIAVVLGWLGVLVTPAIVAVLTRERAAFAAVAGLIVSVPLEMTDTFSGGGPLKAATVFAKSCQIDFDPSTDLDPYKVGSVIATLAHVLLVIFIAKFISTWLARKDAHTLPQADERMASLVGDAR